MKKMKKKIFYMLKGVTMSFASAFPDTIYAGKDPEYIDL